MKRGMKLGSCVFLIDDLNSDIADFDSQVTRAIARLKEVERKLEEAK